ncbi:Hypothetical protein A7982_09034 [Minicystis rosea]|nr:Hypothetical protein A7982_09034 [Minicystis rosea]
MSTPFLPRRLDPAARSALLRRIIDRVREQSRTSPAVVVFDLDGTLMDNRPRVVAILHELAEHWYARHPDAAACCARATDDDIGYGFVENLRRLGVQGTALHEEGFAFWKQRFFNDPHVRHDVEVKGARAFAHAVHEAGAVVVYLTGRDLPNMALGSFASLRDRGFPIGVIGTELVVKPRFETPDHVFKRSVAPDLSRLGKVIASFDNEPMNVNIFLEAHPGSIGVFLDTQYAPNPPDLDALAEVIHTFEMDP